MNKVSPLATFTLVPAQDSHSGMGVSHEYEVLEEAVASLNMQLKGKQQLEKKGGKAGTRRLGTRLGSVPTPRHTSKPVGGLSATEPRGTCIIFPTWRTCPPGWQARGNYTVGPSGQDRLSQADCYFTFCCEKSKRQKH